MAASRSGSGLSYDFLNQVYNDMGYIVEHPALVPAEGRKIEQARVAVSRLCKLIHGEYPNAE